MLTKPLLNITCVNKLLVRSFRVIWISRSMIQDHSDHVPSNEQLNPPGHGFIGSFDAP